MRKRPVFNTRPALCQPSHGKAAKTPGKIQLVPAKWAIFSAPRPLVGHLCWSGSWMGTGAHFAAVDLDDKTNWPSVDWMLEELRKLDATRLYFVTEKQAVTAAAMNMVGQGLTRGEAVLAVLTYPDECASTGLDLLWDMAERDENPEAFEVWPELAMLSFERE